MANAVWGSIGIGVMGLVLAACSGTTIEPPDGSAGGSNVAGSSNVAGAPGSAGSGTAGSAGSATYSPDSCQTAGGEPVPSTGGKQTPEDDCPSGVALGVIDAASSGWDEGGLCCAPVPGAITAPFR